LSDGIENDKLQGANRFLYAFVDTVQDGIRVNLSIKKGWAGCNLRGTSVYGRWTNKGGVPCFTAHLLQVMTD